MFVVNFFFIKKSVPNQIFKWTGPDQTEPYPRNVVDGKLKKIINGLLSLWYGWRHLSTLKSKKKIHGAHKCQWAPLVAPWIHVKEICSWKILYFCDHHGSPDTWCQFHQHFTCGFFVQKFFAQLFLHLNFWFELFLAQEYWHKCAHKMLVKLTPGFFLML